MSYADDTAILTMNENVTYVLDKLVNIEKNYRMKINNNEKTKVVGISRKRQILFNIRVYEENFNLFIGKI